MLIVFIIYCSSPPARITPPEGHGYLSILVTESSPFLEQCLASRKYLVILLCEWMNESWAPLLSQQPHLTHSQVLFPPPEFWVLIPKATAFPPGPRYFSSGLLQQPPDVPLPPAGPSRITLSSHHSERQDNKMIELWAQKPDWLYSFSGCVTLC